MSNQVVTIDEGVGEPDFSEALSTPSRLQLSWTGWLPLLLAFVASMLLLAGLKLPLWQMHMEAPQYRNEEALQVAVFPGRMQGDLTELAVLNQYIGVHVPETLPQFKWLPRALLTCSVLGLLAGFLPATARRIGLLLVACGLAAALTTAMIQAKTQMHDIGHKRDRKTVLTGVRDFTPPLLGTTRIAQFDVTSRLGLGAWAAGGALVLFAGGAWRSRRKAQAS